MAEVMLRRAFSLARGFRLHFFVFSLLLCAATTGLVILRWPIHAVLESLPDATAVLIATTTNDLVFNILGSSLISVATVVAYFDLRVRKEGLDLEELASLVDVLGGRCRR